jgi:hypothetical protein
MLEQVSPTEAIELKNELLAAGLVIDQDCVWRYYQARWDDFSHAGVDPATVIFEFADSSLATFYQLKWQGLR